MKVCTHFKPRTRSGVFNLIFMNLLIASILLQVVSTTKLCAKLQSSTQPYSNNSLEVSSRSVIGNLAEEFLTSDKAWNIPAYWSVEPTCELKACDGVYLSGNCKTFSNGISSSVETWASAECKCSGNCNCTDIHLKRNVCGRAYLKPGDGCNSCGSPYTELEPGENKPFPDIWRDQLVSFLVRKGCKLNVYEGEEDDEDAEIFEGPIYKEWSNDVGSYECTCDNGDYQPEVMPTTTSTIASLEMPTTLDDVLRKFSEHNYEHPGLLAAFTSLVHRRSSKNAYILTIGSSGAGKSSAINVLLGQDNMSETGGHESTTSEILEFRIPLPLPELGIANSELRIIDTPGMGDTRGLTYDALFLATLDDYLSGHEELKTRIPNLVLIFHKFTDNRFDGESAGFVSMVRALDTFRNKITDENYSNVVFVFSHLCSETKQHQKNPLPRLMRFKEVIEKYSLFPKPIITSVIENKGSENHVHLKNGNFELPNGEFFPQNLIQRLQAITRNGNDKIGHAMVEAAFTQRRLGEDVTPNMIKYDLVSSTTHTKVTRYLNILTAATLSITTTDVSKSLDEAYEDMPSSLKTQNPNSLEDLQRKLHIRNIHSNADLPQTSLSILELLKGLGENDAYAYLLEKGLNLKPPVFSSNNVAGYSYSLLKDAMLPSTPFKLDEMKTSPIGFLIPDAFKCTSVGNSLPSYKFSPFDNKMDYFNFRLEMSLGSDLSKIANSTEILNAVTGKIKDGYFVKDVSCGAGKCNFVVPRDYKRFEFQLGVRKDKQAKLTPEFIQRVNGLQEFDQSDHENVDNWTRFFNDFGTHVIVKASGGGRINFRFAIPSQTSAESAVKEVAKSIYSLDDILQFVLKYKENPRDIITNASAIPHSIVFQGGSQSYHISDLAKLTLEEAVPLFKKWKDSLDFYPSVFPLAAVQITEVIENFISKNAAVKFDEPLRRLLSSSLTFIPPPPPTPDPKILEEIERQRKEAEEQVRQLEEKKRLQAEEAERQRLAAIEAQRKRDEDARIEAERRARQLREEEEKRIRDAEQLARRQREEAARIRRQQEENERLQRERLRQIEEEARRTRERLEWEWRRQREEAERNRRRSCLKKGTKILLADYTEKPVELIKVGDLLLDQELRPTRVLGASYEFLLNQRFYSFDNNSFFFTDTHLFVGEGGESDSSILYTTSTAKLYSHNPLLEYLNVRDFGDHQLDGAGKGVKLTYFDRKSVRTVQKDISIFEEPKAYPETTPIYFIHVDSPSGTYFAEGYVCRHEIPPMEHWPNTLSTLFQLFETKGFETVAELPYTIQTLHAIDRISDKVQLAVITAIETQLLNNMTELDNRSKDNCQKQGLEDFDVDEVVGKMFRNPTLSDFSMEMYGGAGKIIAKYLDSPEVKMGDCKVAEMQHILFDVISQEIERSLEKELETLKL